MNIQPNPRDSIYNFYVWSLRSADPSGDVCGQSIIHGQSDRGGDAVRHGRFDDDASVLAETVTSGCGIAINCRM